MANSSPDKLNSDIYYCCDFYHDSSSCPYAHVTKKSDLKTIDVRRIICPFNLSGKCKYNVYCIFAHLNDSESQEVVNNMEEVVDEESNIYLNRSDEPVSAKEQSPEKVNSHSTQHSKPDSLELVNCNFAVAEQLEEVLSFDENRVTEKANTCDRTLEHDSTFNVSSSQEEEFIKNTDEDLETVSHLSNEMLCENLESAGLESMAINTSQIIGDSSISKRSLPLNKGEAIAPSVQFQESLKENKAKELSQNQLENEDNLSGDTYLEVSATNESSVLQNGDNNEVKSDTHLELIATNEPLVSQNSSLDIAAIDTSSQPSNNVKEELEPSSIASGTQECGICQESIKSSENSKAIFGILLNCNHTFCLDCIKKWREQGSESETEFTLDIEYEVSSTGETFLVIEETPADSVDKMTARSCPICRTQSPFVIPSDRWVKNDEEKDELVASYKAKNSKINCRYFKIDGLCKFGKSCFFLHSAYHCRQLKHKYCN